VRKPNGPGLSQTASGDTNVKNLLRMEDIMEARIIRRRRLEALAVAGVLVAALASTLLGQTSGTQPVVTQGGTFLTPLPPRFTIHPGEAGYPKGICRERSFLRCPAVLVFGGANGGLPTIDPRFKVYAPNVRVSMILEKVVNEVAGHGGIEPFQGIAMDLRWETTSSAADLELPYVAIGANSAVPGTWTLPNPVVIYDALVFGACETLNSFPVDHFAFVDWNVVPIGAFHGVDNSTIDSTGFYTFKYNIPAQLDNGSGDLDASIFTLSGKVNVTCTGLNSLV
jgi:hypothetical protein